ncbi:MAG TPA: LysM peptidoglycan-binding domain-containing protein [Anaerolineae bacterium]
MNVENLPLRYRKPVVVLLILLVVLMASVSTSYAQTGVQHTVRRGEYLAVIAQQYGTTVQAILSANPSITNPNLIYSGTVLVIPVSAASGRPQGTIQISAPAQPSQPAQPASQPARSGCRVQHYVRYGDNLIRLGQQYGVSPFAIAEANSIYNLNRIFAGQSLCIP